MDKWALPLKYTGKIGGSYTIGEGISITPSATVLAGNILGSLRWKSPDLALALTSLNLEIFSTTGLSAIGLTGVGIKKVTDYTVDATGGTDITDTAITSCVTGMPDIKDKISIKVLSSATAAMTAGTRTQLNTIYANTSFMSTQSGVGDKVGITTYSTGDDNPQILLENEGLEIFNLYDFAEDKNMRVGIIMTVNVVPTQVVLQHYGLA